MACNYRKSHYREKGILIALIRLILNILLISKVSWHVFRLKHQGKFFLFPPWLTAETCLSFTQPFIDYSKCDQPQVLIFILITIALSFEDIMDENFIFLTNLIFSIKPNFVLNLTFSWLRVKSLFIWRTSISSWWFCFIFL